MSDQSKESQPAFAEPVDHALLLARRGIPVFPVRSDKKPRVSGGFTAATVGERQIRRWWARWPNALVGVPTGSVSGLVVIDIDPDGVDFVLGEYGELLETGRRHNTRRGFHYLFRASPDTPIRCSTSKLARGVDVRGDGGYIIWWPACGLGTAGPDIDKLLPVPTQLLERLTSEASRLVPQLLSPSSPITDTPDSLRCLKEALRKRDSDCGYDEWIRIGMALHHESGGSQAGFCIWDEWSKRGKKYQGADDLRTHWDSFSSEPGKNVVTAGTILRGDTASADEFGTRGLDANRRRFAAIPDHQFVERAPLSWHIKGVLPRAEVVVLYGPSGSGKSFFGFDMVAAVATGSRWHGRRTTRGRVVYIVAEGATGFLNRLKAYAKTRSGSLPGIRIVADAPNLLGELDHASLATEIDATGGADLLVIDTLAASSPGADENAAKDMGRVIEHCKQLHKATGATVLLVHHSGKDESKGARGWSGLRAAADAEIEVKHNGDHRTATVTKMKDGEDGAQFAFKLVPVDVGVDDDGEPVSSCVVEQLAVVPAGTRKEPRPGSVARTLLDAIRDDPSADGRVSVPAAIQAAMPLLPQPSGRDTRRQHLMRALRTLASDGFITVEGDTCRLL